jgi:MYXO-CTERM domain-containing protein
MQRLLQRRVVAVLVLALLVAVVPTAAQAKGATAATISGGGPGGLPGGPLTIKGDGEPGSGSDLSNLAEQAGVWTVLFEDGPGGELASAPAATDRGPRYTLTWTFPNGAGTEDKVRQSVWPYAAGGPLTYMASGQRVLDGTTKGGWFRATDSLRLTLITLGLPSRQPLTATAPAKPATPASPAPAAPAAQTSPTPDPAPAVWPRVAVGLVLVLAVAGALFLRRRSNPGAAATP